MSPRCGCQDVVSQLLPRFLHLLVSRPVVAKMWSPSCLPHVVSQVLSPSCFQRFYTCCLVFHLSPRCGLPVVSQMWFPRCCLTVRWFWVVFQVFCRCGLPVVSYMSPRCGLPVVSQMWFLDVVSLSGCCLVVFDPSPTCGLSSCLLDLVSQMLAPGLIVASLSSTSFPDAVSQLSPRCGFWGVVFHSCCCLVVFHLSPR